MAKETGNKLDVKGNPMKMFKYLLILLGSGALLMGCATSDKPVYGGMGNDTEISAGTGTSPLAIPPAQAGPVGNGPNGSVSRSNPFGAGGTGVTTVN